MKEGTFMKTNNNKVYSKRNVVLPIFSIILILTIALSLVSCTGFSLTGKWKNIGDTSFGQISPGGILVFDGTYCNLYSIKDTYAYSDGQNSGQLDLSSYLFGEHLSFDVQKFSNNRIKIKYGSVVLELERVS